VTVDIGQVSGDTWAMEVTDDTSGGNFVEDAPFDGSEATAEWIVEATTDQGDCNGVCPLAEYTDSNGNEPGVTFSNLGLSGTDDNWYRIDMVQNGIQVSTPSNYTTNASGTGVTGFSVSYTGQGGSTIQPALRRARGIVKGKFKVPHYERMRFKGDLPTASGRQVVVPEVDGRCSGGCLDAEVEHPGQLDSHGGGQPADKGCPLDEVPVGTEGDRIPS
jgi:hypothetical protein